jgi:predicted transcriptional regulator
MKVITIGIMPQEEVRARAIAIARGQYKPRPSDPKIWFPSMKSLAETLSDKNMELILGRREGYEQRGSTVLRLSGRKASRERWDE